MLETMRGTKNEKTLGVIRIFIGMMFFSTGIMKFLVPMLWNAWSGQLTQANIPLYNFNLWFVPIVEMITGITLAVGFFARAGAIVVMVMMLVATYVHLVVDDPTLFPLQPEDPIIPLITLAMAGYILWRGSGAWSMDLKSTQEEHECPCCGRLINGTYTESGSKMSICEDCFDSQKWEEEGGAQ